MVSFEYSVNMRTGRQQQSEAMIAKRENGIGLVMFWGMAEATVGEVLGYLTLSCGWFKNQCTILLRASDFPQPPRFVKG